MSASASLHGDRGAAITAVVFLEYALRQAIRRRLTTMRSEKIDTLFDEYKPLYTLDARIEIAHALNIFGDRTKLMLLDIKHIRNTFAHSPLRISFKTAEIEMNVNALEPYYADLFTFGSRHYTARYKFLTIVAYRY